MAVAKVSEKAKYGGHDYEFCDKVPEELICNICTKPLLEPHLTVCCGQYYCESCLKYWFTKQKKESCPHCRAEGVKFQHVPNKAIERKVNELKIRCTNHKDGCQWVGELSSSQSHLKSDKGCGFVGVSCTNKCGDKMKRKDLTEHTRSHCLLRQYKCKYCGHEDTYHVITAECGSKGTCYQHYTSHYQTCQNYPVECPNNCNKVIQRKDMIKHCEQCPLETVECPFKDAGCDARLVRKEFESHMTLNTQQHLLLVMGSHQTLIQKHRMLEEKVKNLESTVRELQMARTSTLASMDTLLESCTEDQKPHLQTMKAVAQSYHLKEAGDSITITMINFSHYKRSGTVWCSPPFYYKEGYKMCLEVHPSGVRSGAGSHVSLSLLMKGEFDDKLAWPIYFDDLSVTLAKQPFTCEMKRDYFPLDLKVFKCVRDSKVLMSDECFASNRTIMSNCIRNDSLAFSASVRFEVEYLEEYEEDMPCIFSFNQ